MYRDYLSSFLILDVSTFLVFKKMKWYWYIDLEFELIVLQLWVSNLIILIDIKVLKTILKFYNRRAGGDTCARPRAPPSRERALASHPSQGRKSVHFSPPPSDGEERLEVLQSELSRLTRLRGHRGGNVHIFGYKYTKKGGWIRPWNAVCFSGWRGSVFQAAGVKKNCIPPRRGPRVNQPTGSAGGRRAGNGLFPRWNDEFAPWGDEWQTSRVEFRLSAGRCCILIRPSPGEIVALMNNLQPRCSTLAPRIPTDPRLLLTLSVCSPMVD